MITTGRAAEAVEVLARGGFSSSMVDAGDTNAIPALEKLLEDPYNQRIALQIKTAIKRLRRKAQVPAPGVTPPMGPP